MRKNQKLMIIAFFAMIFSTALFAQKNTQVLYFGHAGYTGKLNYDEGIDNQSAFNTGGFNLFLTSSINDNFNIL